MNETKLKGLTTELQCQLFFIEHNYNVSTPICEDCRYDMIVDVDGILLRIQVKHCRLTKSGNGIVFATKSTQVNSKGANRKVYTKKDIDYFATFYDENCYMVKVEECSATKTLCFDKSLITQNYIDDYSAEKILNDIKNNASEGNPVTNEVYQYSLDNVLINKFPNANEAAKYLGDKNKNCHITDCLNGKYKTAYGYKWYRKAI